MEKKLDLLKQLQENKNWPLRYMFKFIVPNNEGKVDEVKKLLPENGELKFKHTKNLKFVSITCVAHMPDAQSIVDVNTAVNKIQGVISL